MNLALFEAIASVTSNTKVPKAPNRAVERMVAEARRTTFKGSRK